MTAFHVHRSSVVAGVVAVLTGVLLAFAVSYRLASHGDAGFRHSGTTAAHSLPWAVPLRAQQAPDFSLRDQFNHVQSLRSFHGQEVVLAFVDARCTSVCPLTTEILRAAKTTLGPNRAAHVALVGINANPVVTGVAAVYKWSAAHGMTHKWTFLTGSPRELRSAYAHYHIYDRVTPNKQIVHDAAVILLDAKGRERLYFSTSGMKDKPTVKSEELAYAEGMSRWAPN